MFSQYLKFDNELISENQLQIQIVIFTEWQHLSGTVLPRLDLKAWHIVLL